MKSFWLGALILLSAASPVFSTLTSAQDYGTIPDFELTDQTGQSFRRSDLAGKIWVADFIFTRCPGPCPLLSSQMAELRKKLPAEVKLVSFSVDPEYDDTEVLSEYSKRFGADPADWKFLSGDKAEIFRLLNEGFHVGVTSEKDQTLTHSLKFALVDATGRIRGYFDGDNPLEARQIPFQVKVIQAMSNRPWVLRLPALNACLNAACAFLLLIGFMQILKRNVSAHKACMTAAFATSTLFLTSYLTYHAIMGSKPYAGTGAMRTAYFAILISHTVLAVVILPMILGTFRFAWKETFDKHKKLARWTLPLWLYVSVTGVVVYGMLYHF